MPHKISSNLSSKYKNLAKPLSVITWIQEQCSHSGANKNHRAMLSSGNKYNINYDKSLAIEEEIEIDIRSQREKNIYG